jgi:heme-degrading monooxygenase HmoA
LAVLAIYQVKGDTDDLLDKFDRSVAEIERTAHGVPLSHVVARAPDGITVYDVWESEEDIDRFTSNPSFQQALQSVEMPPPETEVQPVHRVGWDRKS